MILTSYLHDKAASLFRSLTEVGQLVDSDDQAGRVAFHDQNRRGGHPVLTGCDDGHGRREAPSKLSHAVTGLGRRQERVLVVDGHRVEVRGTSNGCRESKRR